VVTPRDAVPAPDPLEIEIVPVWKLRHRGERQFDFVLVKLLEAIKDTGRLTDASRRASISYRHAWNVIEKWGAFLGSPLVLMERGRGTRLTPLGEKLLWAGQRVDARLTPQLQSLSSELARALNETLTRTTPALRLHASHDYAVAGLRERLNQGGRTRLDLQYRGSIDALAALCHGACDVAGFHIADGPLEGEILARYAKWMKPRIHRLVRFVTRTQGFVVAPGNPKGIRTVADLARPGVRLINRQRGSGTRTLLEQLLAQAGLSRARIEGFENEEYTHAAVAALVAGRLADVGFGVRAAADQFGLDFVPVATERYFLILRTEMLEHATVRELLAFVRDDEFGHLVAALAGYGAERAGEIVTIPEALPWGDVREPRSEAADSGS
jgi:molybdate transport repressor ModE-like protein